MGGRQKESDTSCADIYPRQSAQASQETGTRRGPSYLVHVKRNSFHDPALPPFWELTVENARHRYRVLVGVPADELDLVIQSLPEPTSERHGVDFRRGVTEVILPEDIRRLSGETAIMVCVYKVSSAPAGSPYRKGQRFTDADLTRPVTFTQADVDANDRRREAFLRQFEAEIADKSQRSSGV